MTGVSIHIPTLEQAPLVLRAPTRDDIGTVARMMQNQPSRFFGEQLSFERAVSIIHEHVSFWVTDGLGFWTIIQKDAAIGMVGFSNGTKTPELDIALDENAENQGFGTQACRMVLDWLFDAKPDTRCVGYCVEEGNERAHALARRLNGKLVEQDTDPFGGTTTDTWYQIGVQC